MSLVLSQRGQASKGIPGASGRGEEGEGEVEWDGIGFFFPWGDCVIWGLGLASLEGQVAENTISAHTEDKSGPQAGKEALYPMIGCLLEGHL